LARPYWRLLGIALGLTLIAVRPAVMPNDYRGIHLVGGLSAVTLYAASLAGLRYPRRLSVIVRFFSDPNIAKPTLATFALAASLSLVKPPSSAVAVELMSTTSSILPYYLLSLFHEVEPLRKAEIPAEARDWFQDRSALPPIPPTDSTLFPQNPVVVLVTIDSLRADVLLSGKYDAQMPVLAALRSTSLNFRNAHSGGPATAPSLTSLFMGSHYSSQYWTRIEGKLSPYQDERARFPELLGKGGVRTAAVVTQGFESRYGMVRGF